MTRRENDKHIEGVPTELCKSQQGNVQFTKSLSLKVKHHVSEGCKEIEMGFSHEECIYSSDEGIVLIPRNQVTRETSKENVKAFENGSSKVEDNESTCVCGHEQSRIFAELCGRSCSTGYPISVRTCSKCNCILDQENLKDHAAANTVILHDENSQTESKKQIKNSSDILDVQLQIPIQNRLKTKFENCSCEKRWGNIQCNCKLDGCCETECREYQTSRDTQNTKVECKLRMEQVFRDRGLLETAGETCDIMEEEIEVDVIGDDERLNNSQTLHCTEIKISPNEGSFTTNEMLETSGEDGSRQTVEPLNDREDKKLISGIDSKELSERLCNKWKRCQEKTCHGARDASTCAPGGLSTDVSLESTVEQSSPKKGFDVSLPIDEQMENEGDGYNRFYFESDNLALKDNEQ